jgi:tetratricopeptide (TPR) repeat protein
VALYLSLGDLLIDLSRFWGVFWIDVSTTDLAERSFLDVAQKLAIPAQTWEDARLGIANFPHPWLLVLDNADDPEVDYQDYFPGGRRGVVMLTSRNDECQQYATAKSIALEGLDDGEARDLLLKAAGVPQDQYGVFGEDAAMVAELLQFHPLALIQAGAYVARGHCTLAEYPHVYERQRQRLLTFRPSQARSRYRDVYATFEVSAAALASSETAVARDALQLLPLLAVCGPSRLPLPLFEAGWKGAKGVSPHMDDDAEDDNVSLLTPWHVAHLPSLLDTTGDTWDSFRLVEAVSLLKALSLVSTHSHDGLLSVSTHPLVHAWARDRQNNAEQRQHWLQMGCVMAFALSQEAFWHAHGRQIQSHVEVLTAWEVATMFAAESPMLVVRVLVNCGFLLNMMRADVKLLILMEKIYVSLRLDQLKVAHAWVGLYDLTARNLGNHGKVNEAVSLLKQVVKIREQTLAEDHPDRLVSQHELAGLYRTNGQIKEAMSLLKQVVKIQQRTQAEDHPNRLASQHTLAMVYHANGQAKEAVSLLKQVVKIRERTLAEDHSDRLASQHELAGAHQTNGQIKEAILLLKQVVKIREQTLAEDHPHRLASQHTLAMAYVENGQTMEAISLLEQVVKINRLTLGNNHLDRLASQQVLAVAYTGGSVTARADGQGCGPNSGGGSSVSTGITTCAGGSI